MKVLFAIRDDDNIINSLIRKYKADFGKELLYKEANNFTAIIKELQENNDYDRIIVSDDFDKRVNQSDDKEAILFKKLKGLLSVAKGKSGKEIPVIFLANNRRTAKVATDNNIYNFLVGKDVTKKNIYELIKKSRNKSQANEYHKLVFKSSALPKSGNDMKKRDKNLETKDETKIAIASKQVEEVPNVEKYIKYFKRDNIQNDKCIERFERACSQLSRSDLIILVDSLNTEVKKLLRKNSQKFKKIEEKIREKNGAEKKNEKVSLGNAVEKKSHNNITEEKQDDKKEKSSEEANVKKRRGRPRKVVNSEELVDQQVKRGRGRPRKNPIEEMESVDKKNEEVVDKKTKKEVDKKADKEVNKKIDEEVDKKTKSEVGNKAELTKKSIKSAEIKKDEQKNKKTNEKKEPVKVEPVKKEDNFDDWDLEDDDDELMAVENDIDIADDDFDLNFEDDNKQNSIEYEPLDFDMDEEDEFDDLEENEESEEVEEFDFDDLEDYEEQEEEFDDLEENEESEEVEEFDFDDLEDYEEQEEDEFDDLEENEEIEEVEEFDFDDIEDYEEQEEDEFDDLEGNEESEEAEEFDFDDLEDYEEQEEEFDDLEENEESEEVEEFDFDDLEDYEEQEEDEFDDLEENEETEEVEEFDFDDLEDYEEQEEDEFDDLEENEETEEVEELDFDDLEDDEITIEADDIDDFENDDYKEEIEISEDDIMNFEEDDDDLDLIEDDDLLESDDDNEYDLLSIDDSNEDIAEDSLSSFEDDDTEEGLLDFDDSEDIMDFDDELSDELDDDAEDDIINLEDDSDDIINLDEDSDDEGLLDFEDDLEEASDDIIDFDENIDENSDEDSNDDELFNFGDDLEDDSDDDGVLTFGDDLDEDLDDDVLNLEDNSDDESEDIMSLDNDSDDNIVNIDFGDTTIEDNIGEDPSNDSDEIMNLDEEYEDDNEDDLFGFDSDENEDEEEKEDFSLDADDNLKIEDNNSFSGIKNKNYMKNYDISKQISAINGDDTLDETSSTPVTDNNIEIGDTQNVVAFVGSRNSGNSFIVNNIGQLLSEQGVKTAIVDLTKNKNSYYIYTENEENLRNIAYSSFEKLKSGIADGIKVNKNLTVYTALPNSDSEIEDKKAAMSTLLNNYSLILLDCDFDTDLEYFDISQDIFFVQTFDILTIQGLTSFIKKLKMNKVEYENKMKIVINKKVNLNSINERAIVAAVSVYNSPDTTYQLDLFDRNKVEYVVMPFEEKNYCKYLDDVVKCKLTIRGYSKSLINSLNKLARMVYPINGRKNKAK